MQGGEHVPIIAPVDVAAWLDPLAPPLPIVVAPLELQPSAKQAKRK